MKRASRNGFVLVELLVAALIMTIVAGVIAACVAGGIRVWERAQTFNAVETEIMPGLAMLEKDLANSFEFYAIPFLGGPGQVSFPGMAPGERDNAVGASAPRRIGTVAYVFDGNGRTLRRQTLRFPGEMREIVAGQGEIVMRNIQDVRFEYGESGDGNDGAEVSGAVSGEPAWTESWDNATNRPCAVRVNIRFSRSGSGSETVRTVNLAP